MALTVAALFSDFLVKNSKERTKTPSMENRETHARTAQDFLSPYLRNKDMTRTCKAIIHQQLKILKSKEIL